MIPLCQLSESAAVRGKEAKQGEEEQQQEHPQSQAAAVGHNELLAIIDDAAKQISVEVMPWDE